MQYFKKETFCRFGLTKAKCTYFCVDLIGLANDLQASCIVKESLLLIDLSFNKL